MAPAFGRPWFAIFNTNPVQVKDDKPTMPSSIDFQPSLRVSQFGGRLQKHLNGATSSPLVQDHVAAVAMRAKLEARKASPQATVRLLEAPPRTLADATGPRSPLPLAASAIVTSASTTSAAVETASKVVNADAQITAPPFLSLPPVERVAQKKTVPASPPPALTIPLQAPCQTAAITPRGTSAIPPPHTPGSSGTARAGASTSLTAESDLVTSPAEVAARWSREEWLHVVRAVEGASVRCLKCPKQSDAATSATHSAIHLIQGLKIAAARTPGAGKGSFLLSSNAGNAAAAAPKGELSQSPTQRALFTSTSSGSSDDTTFVDDPPSLVRRTSCGSASASSEDDYAASAAARYNSYGNFAAKAATAGGADAPPAAAIPPSPSGCPRTPFSHMTQPSQRHPQQPPPQQHNQQGGSFRGFLPPSPSQTDGSTVEISACPFINQSARQIGRYSSYEAKGSARSSTDEPLQPASRTMPFMPSSMATRGSADASLPVRSSTMGASVGNGGSSSRSVGMSSSIVHADAMNRKLLTVITKTHEIFSRDMTPNGSQVADYLLSQLLDLTQSESGFIASALKRPDGSSYLKTHSITNVAWTRDLREWYAENAPKGLVFSNLNTIFGRVVTSADVVMSNDVQNDSRGSGQGVPPGHPVMQTFLGVPLFSGPDLVGMFAVSNREGGYNEGLLMGIQPVTKTVAQVVMGVQQRRKKWEAEERLNDMLEATQHAMLAVSAGGKLTCANRAARSLFGLEGGAEGDVDTTGGKLPLGLKLADLLVSIDGDDSYMERGLHAFAHEALHEWAAEGRQQQPQSRRGESSPAAAGTKALTITIAKGSSSDVAFVVTARETGAGQNCREEGDGGGDGEMSGREDGQGVEWDEAGRGSGGQECELVLSSEDGTLTILA